MRLCQWLRGDRGLADGPIILVANREKLNSKIAAMLGAPMLLILDYDAEPGLEGFYAKVMIAASAVRDNGAEVLGFIVNKVVLLPSSFVSKGF